MRVTLKPEKYQDSPATVRIAMSKEDEKDWMKLAKAGELSQKFFELLK